MFKRRWWLSALVILTLLGLGIVFWLGFAARDNGTEVAGSETNQKKPVNDIYRQDFRAGRFDDQYLIYYLEHAANHIKHEQEGLRISLPANKPYMPPTGIAWHHSIKGDFEIAVTYEILEAEKPKSGRPSELVVLSRLRSGPAGAVDHGRGGWAGQGSVK